MKHFYSTLLLATSLLLSTEASATIGLTSQSTNRITYQTRNGKTMTSRLRNDRVAQMNTMLNSLDDEKKGNTMMRVPSAGNFEPDFTFGPTANFGDIDGPNGEMWFFTMERVQEPIHYEYFTDYKLISFTISIYDADHQLVGKISDKVHYINEEWRTPMCELLPVVTRHFFNNDDKIELVMEFAVNTKNDGSGGVRYYSKAYQIGGEKDAEGFDKSIYEFPCLIANVLDATQPGQPEKAYMTSMQDISPAVVPDNDSDMWEYRLGCKQRLTIYGPADAQGNLQELVVKDICLQNLPGNQDTTPQVITFTEGGKPYALIQQYGETLYMPFYGATDEILQRQSNSLEIDIYNLEDGSVFQHTSIPFTQSDEDKEKGLLNLYSVGDCTYRTDINFHDYSDNGSASFIVTKNNTGLSSGNVESLSYYVYGSDGARKATIYENASSVVTMQDVAGTEPQCMFLTTDGEQYAFNFVGLHSFKKLATIYQYLEIDGSDPDPMLANLDRVAYGDSYRYAFEMRYPTEDNDISYMRIAWFNADGTHSHIDEVNMGSSVRYAQSLMSGLVLDPKTFLTDEAPEYAIIIKRGAATGATEEFLIGQACSDEYPEGRDVLHLVPGAKGTIGNIIPFMGAKPMLGISYIGGNGYSIDFYDLPLDANNSGIGSVEGDRNDGNITIDGNNVCAQGYTVELFSLQGIQLGAASERLDISAYPAGVYIVKAGESTRKIIKK